MKSLQGFPLLWLASTTSALGDGVRWIALPLLAVQQSTDPGTVSLITAAEQAPWLIFGLFAGVLADRYDRRRVILSTDLARALLMAGFAVAVLGHRGTIAMIAVLGFLLTCGETISGAATSGLIPALVPAGRRPAANGRLQAGVLVTDTLVGSPLGALLFTVAAVAPFAVDAATFLGAAILIALLPGRYSPAGAAGSREAGSRETGNRETGNRETGNRETGNRETGNRGTGNRGTGNRETGNREAGSRRVRAEIAEGIRFLWGHRLLRLLAGLTAVNSVIFTGLVAILVLYAAEVLHLTPTGYGLLVATFAIGGIGGGLAAGRLAAALGTRTCLVGAVAAYSLCAGTLGLTGNVVVAGGVIAIFGAAAAVSGAVTASVRQTAVPDPLLGRVTSAFRLVNFGAGPLGALAAGALGHAFGLRAPFLVAAGVTLVMVPVTARYLAAGRVNPIDPSRRDTGDTFTEAGRGAA